MTPTKFDPNTQKNLELWLNGSYDEKTKEKIRTLIKENPSEVIDSFYTNLSFGTGGLRGIMGVGSNRINVYTIRSATQGLAAYILKHQDPGKNGVFIGYDSRNNSKWFAEETAKVLAANNILVYLCPEMRPVPFVSFGCRYKNCQAAVVITASHNPAIYNGYKVYWCDGGQVVPPHDTGIIEEVKKINDVSMVKEVSSLDHPLIQYVTEEVDQAYLSAMSEMQNYPEENQKFGQELNITYSSLHGTGITLLPKAFAKWGFTHMHFVEQQIIPDGNFSTVSCPNPEEDSALHLGVETMKQYNSDIFLATDPDADRVGVVVKHKGEYLRLNGNQIACLCLEHVCKAVKRNQKLSPKSACVKTIVTSELFQAIANAYQVTCFNVLTGFKYIAEMIHLWEKNHEYQYLFGGEESYGYLRGTYTRDKDAIVSSALIAEAALHAKREGKTLIDLVNDLYAKYGNYVEELFSYNFSDTKEGRDRIISGMKKLQQSPPQHLLGNPILMIEDYTQSKRIDLKNGKTETLNLPKSNVLTFWLEDRTKLIVRPSGTEPKIKFYCGVNSKNETLDQCRAKAHRYIEAIKTLI